MIETDDTVGDLATLVEVVTPGGIHRAAHDVSRPATDLGAQGEQLRRKFDALAGPTIGDAAAADLAERLSDLTAVAEVSDLLAISR